MDAGWLRAMRKRKCLTQKQVALAIGISQPSYANIELGKRSPSVQTAKKIGTLFSFDWTEFYKNSPSRTQRYWTK